MNIKDIQTEIIKKSDIIAREISKGNDIEVTKTASGIKILIEVKKTLR